MPFKIVRNDITRMKVDVIVNTANELPVYSDGTDAAVYRAAGEEELLAERRKIGTLAEGNVAITPGFRLPAKFIIHAASPYYSGDSEGVEAKLRSCYKKSLELAYEKQCESIAFPLIATGSYGYPKEEGMRIALDEINSFLLTHQMLVYLVVFDETTTGLGQALYPDLESYIDRHYVAKKQEEEYPDRVFGSFSIPQPEYYEERTERGKAKKKRSIQRHFKFQKSVRADSAEQEKHDLSDKSISLSSNAPVAAPYSKNASAAEGVSNCAMQAVSYDEFLEESEAALKERLAHLSDTFVQYLMYLIESKGLTNAEVYKRAIITKQLFSKIKLNSEYHPDKATAMRLCVGAGLSLDETKDLLARAGYALSPCDKRDIIFSYFIEHGVHDMIEIDIALEEHGLPCFIE